MNRKFDTRFLLACALCAGTLVSGAHDVFGSTLELVQSVPLETNLAVPGIPETQQVWLDMIGAAQTSIDLEEFYVSDEAGQALAPVIQAILAAASRGVHVRLLADSQYYKTYPDSVNEIGQTPNCEAETIDFSSQGGVQHAKYFIVDGQQAFVGSQNFDWRSLNQIHEIGLHVTDAKISSDLESIFTTDWAKGSSVSQSAAARSEILAGSFLGLAAQTSDSDLFVVASPLQDNPAGIPDTLSTITGFMAGAQHSIQVQVMDYTTSVYGSSSTWKDLDTAIRSAAARGVQVQLMVDVSSMKDGKTALTALSKLKNVLVKDVTIPQYSGGTIPYARLIHAKYMTVDGNVGWVGSENWSEGYFTNTRDVGLVVQGSENATIVNQLGQVFSQVWNSSYATSAF